MYIAIYFLLRTLPPNGSIIYRQKKKSAVRNRDKDIKNKCMDTKGGGEVE